VRELSGSGEEGGCVTDRETRLRQRIDVLTDERDRARWLYERAALSRDRAQRALYAARAARQLWRRRYYDLRRMSERHEASGRFRSAA
jgi:hypothetical protein